MRLKVKQNLNMFLIKESFTDFEAIIEKETVVGMYQLKGGLDFEGVSFVG